MALRRAFMISFGSAGGQFVLAFASNIILSRLLLPAEIGIFSVAMAVMTILHALREFGIGGYIIKERELTDDKIRTVFGVALLFSWSVAALIYFSRGAIAEFYSEPRVADIFALLSINFIMLPFGQPAFVLLRREQNYSRLTMIMLSSAFAGAGTSILFAVLGYGPIALAYGALAATGINVALSLLSRPGHILMLPSLKEWRSVCGFGGKSSLTTIIMQVGMQAPELLMGRFLGFTAVGLYSRGIGIAKLIETFFVNAVSWVTGAEFGALHRSAQSLADLVLKTTNYTLVICWPALIFLALKSETVIWILYGETWLPAAPLVQALCLARGLQMIVSQAPSVYEGTGAINLRLRNEIILQIVSVGLLLIGVQYGLIAVAWLRVPLGIIVVAVHLSVFRGYADIGVRRMFFAIWRSIAVALGFAGALAGLIALEPAGMEFSPLVLAGEAIVVTLIYFLLVAIFRHPIGAEMQATTKSLLSALKITP